MWQDRDTRAAVERLLGTINRARRGDVPEDLLRRELDDFSGKHATHLDASQRDAARSQRTEEVVEAVLGYPRNRLAVYGSLVPGRSNEWVLADLRGEWRDGHVHGFLSADGWGATEGFPGMVWVPQGERIPVKLLVAEDLPRHWHRIDAFEGPDYQRILVPVFRLDGGVEIANLYEVRQQSGMG